MEHATCAWDLGCDVVGLIGRFLDREDVENCLLSCRDICEAFRSARSQIESDFVEKRRRDLDRFSSFDVVSDRWSSMVALCQPPIRSVDPHAVVVSDRLTGLPGTLWLLHVPGAVIESIKVRGTFRKIDVKVGGQCVLRIGNELIRLQKADDEGFVEIFAHFVNGLNTYDVRAFPAELSCHDCDLQFKVTYGAARGPTAAVSRAVIIQPSLFGTVEAWDRDVADIPLHEAHFRAVGIAFVVRSRRLGTSNLVVSLDLRFVDQDGREVRREIRGRHLRASEFATCIGTTIKLTDDCHFVPLRNLNASRVTQLAVTVRFRGIADYTLNWVYFSENVFVTSDGHGGLAFCC